MIEKEVAYRMIDQLFEIRGKIQEKLIPSEANQHFQKAKKEGLLGIQAILSHAINVMDKEQEMQTKREASVKKIIIEP